MKPCGQTVQHRSRKQLSVLQETQIHDVPHRLQKESRLAQKVDYPAYGGTGMPAATANGTSVSTQLFLCLTAIVRTFLVSFSHFSSAKPTSYIAAFIFITHTSFICYALRWEIRLWLKVLRCITINIRNSRCYQWESKTFFFFFLIFSATPSHFQFWIYFSCIIVTSLPELTSFFFFSHKPEQKAVDTEVTSDEEEVGGDFTVYECPGLAPVGRNTHVQQMQMCKALIISIVCFMIENHIIEFSSLLDRLGKWKWRTLCLMTQLYIIRGIKSECWTLYTHIHTHTQAISLEDTACIEMEDPGRGRSDEKMIIFLLALY